MRRYSTSSLAVFILLIAASPVSLQAQSTGDPSVAPGSPPQTYSLSGLDQVNYYTGLANLVVPIYTVGGRGAASFTVPVDFQRQWVNNGGLTTYPSSNVGVVLPDFFGLGTDNPDHLYLSPVQANGCTATYLVYVAANGTQTFLRDSAYNGQPSCGTAYNRGQTFQSSDGSGLTVITNSAITDGQTGPVTNAVIIDRNGTRRTIGIPGTNFSAGVVGVEDRNGNTVGITAQKRSSNSNFYIATDPLGRTIALSNNQMDGPYTVELQYPGAAGTYNPIIVNFTPLNYALASGEKIQTYHALFPELNGSSGTYFTPLVVNEIILGDQISTYSFSYNSYGEVVRMTLPTGASYTYKYPEAYNGTGDGVVTLPNGQYFIARRLLERDEFLNGSLSAKILFSASGSASGLDPNHTTRSGTTSTVTFEDASSNVLRVEKHYFYGNALSPSADTANTSGFADWWLGLEFRTDVQDGNAKTWQSTQTVYDQRPCASGENCWFDPQSETAQPHDPQVCLVTATNDAGQTSGTAFQYDQYNNITDKYEFDYGSAPAISASCPKSFSAALRYTHTSFVTGSYVASNTNILGLPSTVAVSDGSGTQYALTSYLYDQQALANDAGIAGHDSSYGISFSLRGNPTSVQRWWNKFPSSPATTSLTYDIAGNVVSSTDPNGNTTKFGYNDDSSNEYAFVTSTTNALGQMTSATYDYGAARISTATDLNRNQTQFTYNDSFNRLTNLNFPNGQTVVYGYYSPTAVITTKDQNASGDQALGMQTLYDGLGRPIETDQWESACPTCQPGNIGSVQYIATKTDYDALGRTFHAYNPSRQNPADGLGFGTAYLYDPLGRNKSVTTPDGAVASVSYSGNVVTTLDQKGNSNQYTTDALGRLKNVVEDTGTLKYATIYAYDILNELTTVTKGNETRSFSYDSLGNMTSATNPESGTVTYTYGSAGNPLTRKDNRGITKTFSNFDKLNRPGTVTYSDGTPTVTYSYDAAGVANSKGHLTSVATSGVSTTSYTSFDVMGKVLSSTQVTAGQNYSFQYGYNLSGQLTSETYPSGRVITTGYDGAGRSSTVSGLNSGTSTNYVSNMNYWPHGAPYYFSYGNTLLRAAAYNSRLQLLESYDALNNQNDAAHMLMVVCPNWGASNATTSLFPLCPSWTGTQDNGNLNGLNITQGSTTFSETFGYDAVGRITSASDSGGWSQNYSYDQHGNMWMPSSSGLPAYGAMPATNIYNALNQNPNVTYDAAGNQTTLGSLSLSYDAENSQIIATNTLAGGSASYGYDGMGERVAKTLPTQSNVYVYDAFGRLAAEYSTAISASPCVTCYLSYDHLGSVRMVTDQSGAVMARHDFAPFGQEIPGGSAGRTSLWGSTTDVDPKFTGQLRDTETGEDFFNARYYYGQQTRFLSPDPGNAGAHLADPQTWNAYAYVRGNPLGATDPTGLQCAIASGGKVHANFIGCGNDGNYGPTGGNDVSIDGGSPVPIGTFGSGNPLGGESGVQCPNNVCEGVTPTGASYTISANANGDTFASGLNLLPGLTFNCSGTLDNHQCTPTAFTSLFLQSGSDPMYFGNIAQIFNSNASLWSNTAGAGNALVVGTGAAIALPYAVGYGASLATYPSMNIAFGPTTSTNLSVMYGIEDMGYLQGSATGNVNAVGEWTAERYFNVYNWRVWTVPTANPSAVLATAGESFSSCVMAATCALIKGLSPF